MCLSVFTCLLADYGMPAYKLQSMWRVLVIVFRRPCRKAIDLVFYCSVTELLFYSRLNVGI